MMQILITNRMDRPDIIEQATIEFEEALANPQSIFYILKYDGKYVAAINLIYKEMERESFRFIFKTLLLRSLAGPLICFIWGLKGDVLK